MSRTTLLRTITFLAVCILLWPAGRADAQGVTTGAITGVVKDAQGAVIPGATVLAVHQPSGATYEAVSQADGRFVMPGMRVGPYTVTVRSPGSLRGEANRGQPGRAQDVDFSLKIANVRRRSRSSARATRCSAGTHRRRHGSHARRARDAADQSAGSRTSPG